MVVMSHGVVGRSSVDGLRSASNPLMVTVDIFCTSLELAQKHTHGGGCRRRFGKYFRRQLQ